MASPRFEKLKRRWRSIRNFFSCKRKESPVPPAPTGEPECGPEDQASSVSTTIQAKSHKGSRSSPLSTMKRLNRSEEDLLYPVVVGTNVPGQGSEVSPTPFSTTPNVEEPGADSNDECFTCRVCKKKCMRHSESRGSPRDRSSILRLQCLESHGQSRPAWPAETDSMVVDAVAAWNSNPRNKLGQQIPNLEQLQFALPSLTKEPTPIEGQLSHPATMNEPEGTESQFFLSSRTNGSKQVEEGEPVSTVTNQSKGRKSQTSPISTAPKTKQTEEGQLPLMSTTSSLRGEKSHFSSVSEMGQKGCQESQLYPFPTTGELNRIKVDQRAPISATTNEPMDKEYHVFPTSATNELKWVEEDQHAPVSTGMNELEQARESLNYLIPGTSSSRGTVGKSENTCFTCQVRRKICTRRIGGSGYPCDECSDVRLQCLQSDGQSRSIWLAEKDPRERMVTEAIAAWNSDPRNKLGNQILILEQFQYSVPPLPAFSAIVEEYLSASPHAACLLEDYTPPRVASFPGQPRRWSGGQGFISCPSNGATLVDGVTIGSQKPIVGVRQKMEMGNYRYTASPIAMDAIMTSRVEGPSIVPRCGRQALSRTLVRPPPFDLLFSYGGPAGPTTVQALNFNPTYPCYAHERGHNAGYLTTYPTIESILRHRDIVEF